MRAERAMSSKSRTECIRSNRDTKQHPSSSDTIRWLRLVVHDGNLGRAQIAFPYNAREVDENAVDQIKLRIKADLGEVAQKCNNPTGTNWRYLTLVWEPSDCNWPHARSALQYKDKCFEGGMLCLRAVVRLLSGLSSKVGWPGTTKAILTCKCHHHPRCDAVARCGCFSQGQATRNPAISGSLAPEEAEKGRQRSTLDVGGD
ncbi:uncharacterized protein ACA1_363330 [Acanthamoeba castellanii str. Neff]|uniref:Uncharacterized protein n=1 Tax=Acanthamoeba castellanii (strain ATCC 30010 / Neff) TaxID=1257118 RepID=L8GGF8_ACACF|nr:uncharacterized protein ACA1_363330 [Acanthamoeba castellanii str. Neff]ELR11833.1 hypothetical protein ACA1_363330 [Acanthamoeba castellanii str. Neff]